MEAKFRRQFGDLLMPHQLLSMILYRINRLQFNTVEIEVRRVHALNDNCDE